jgi:uncharacterized protein (DUF433 family)
MKNEELLARISVDPHVCFGKPCIRGTRIWVSLILDNLADGMTEAELLTAYPQLKVEDLRAALAYGAEAAREHVVDLQPAPA